MLYENEIEALRCAIKGSRKTFKEVAFHVFPHLKPESAYARLMACLTNGREHNLTFKQIIEICHFCKKFDVLFYFADQCGFEEPKLKPIENAETVLFNELVKAKDYLQEITSRIEKYYINKYQNCTQR